MDAFKNLAVGTVAVAPSPAISGTSLTLTAGHGSRFPAAPFNATVVRAGVLPDPVSAEVVRVTAVSSDTFTIVRAQEGTSARAIGVGDVVFAGVTAKTIQDINDAIAAGVPPLDGDLVAIAQLTTTPYGRSLLTMADAPAAQDALNVVPGTDVQAQDPDLQAIADGPATTAFGRGLLTPADAAAARVLLGVDGVPALNDIASFRHASLDVVPKWAANNGNIPLIATDRLVLCTFQAPADLVVTGVNMVAGTSLASGQTMSRLVLFHVGDASTADLATNKRQTWWAMARSDSDTTLFTVASVLNSKNFSPTGGWPTRVRLIKGEWYAAGYMMNGGTAPRLSGISSIFASSGQPGLQACAVTASGLGTVDDNGFGMVYGSSMGMQYAIPWVSLNVEQPGGSDIAVRTVTIGDSFIGSYGQWIGVGNAQSGSRLHFVNKSGDGGNQQLTDVLSKIAAHVAPYRRAGSPFAVLLHAGINDIGNGADAATVQSRYTSVFDALQAAGATHIVCCVPPPNSAWSSPTKAVLTSVRSWLLALNRSGVTVADTGIVMTTGDGVTSDGTKVLGDGIHPNATGKTSLANALDDYLAALTF